MSPTISEIKSIIQPWTLIVLTSKGAHIFKGKQGYAGKSFDDSFEFHVVLNEYEHFSNISADPITQPHTVRYEDVIEIKKSGF